MSYDDEDPEAQAVSVEELVPDEEKEVDSARGTTQEEAATKED